MDIVDRVQEYEIILRDAAIASARVEVVHDRPMYIDGVRYGRNRETP